MLPIQQLISNPQMFQMFKQQFLAFAQIFKQSGQNPQQVVQQLLNQGKMTQEQFNSWRGFANKITGLRF